MKCASLKHPGGFTLVELAIVIAILALLGVGIYVFTDIGGRGKSVTLLNFMQQTGGALQRLKADSGCHTQRLAGLWANANNSVANTFCGVAIADGAWRGPYMKPFSIEATSNAGVLDNIVSGARLSVNREAGGIGQRYFLRTASVPNDLIIQALQECNGSTATTVSFNTNKCRGAPGTGATGNGTFDYLYDETR